MDSQVSGGAVRLVTAGPAVVGTRGQGYTLDMHPVVEPNGQHDLIRLSVLRPVKFSDSNR